MYMVTLEFSQNLFYTQNKRQYEFGLNGKLDLFISIFFRSIQLRVIFYFGRKKIMGEF